MQKVNAWRESIEACFQGEQLSQGKNERYDFRVIPSIKGGRYYSYEGKESNQRIINTKKNQRHVDMGRIPKESSIRGRSPKGRHTFPLMSKGER
jgi:hypothetical protein